MCQTEKATIMMLDVSVSILNEQDYSDWVTITRVSFCATSDTYAVIRGRQIIFLSKGIDADKKSLLFYNHVLSEPNISEPNIKGQTDFHIMLDEVHTLDGAEG